MGCCKESHIDVEGMTTNAMGFGFDGQWLADLVAKYGNDVLALVTEAIKNGFSVTLIVDILGKFGPMVLEFLVNLFGKTKSMGIDGVAATVDATAIDFSIIETLLKKYLPIIVDQYGEQIVRLVMTYIMNYLRSLVDPVQPIFSAAEHCH